MAEYRQADREVKPVIVIIISRGPNNCFGQGKVTTKYNNNLC